MPDQKKRDVDAGFWSRADSYIDLANGHCENADAGKVSASLLFAASRFNAFVVASNAASAESLSQSRAEALNYFTEQFRSMLAENLDDHIQNSEKYSAKAAARCLTNRWSGRVWDKVPSSFDGVRAAQLNR